MDMQSKMHQTIDAICKENGCSLIELQLKGGRRNMVVQVYADTEEGITLGQCEHINRLIQDELDMDEGFTRYYRLDVSSPGLDRPLIHDFQLKKYLDKELVFTIKAEDETVKKTAVLKSFNEAVFDVEIDGALEQIDRNMVDRVKVKIQW